MITKQQIEQAQGQELADLVAVHCMGWRKQEDDPFYFSGWYLDNSHVLDLKNWQPHLNTDKGKAQCWDLAEKHDLELDFVLNYARYDDKDNELTHEVNDESMQTALLKACLLSKMGGSDD